MAVVVLAGTAACAGSTGNDHAGSANLNGLPILPTILTLTVGATTEVPSANVSIRFDSVLMDSRCPSDVQCIQAGSATVQLTIAQLTGALRTQLLSLSSLAGRDTATSFGQPIRLLSIAPVPVSTTPPSRSAYHVELRVGAVK